MYVTEVYYPNTYGMFESHQGHHYEETLTKIISILQSWDWYGPAAGNEPASAIGGEHYRKEPFEQLVSHSENMSPRQYSVLFFYY